MQTREFYRRNPSIISQTLQRSVSVGLGDFRGFTSKNCLYAFVLTDRYSYHSKVSPPFLLGQVDGNDYLLVMTDYNKTLCYEM